MFRKMVLSLAIIVVLFTATLAFASPAQAHAVQSISPLYKGPVVTATALKRGAWNNYYFSPTYTWLRPYSPFQIINQTGRLVVITDTYGNYVTAIAPGKHWTTVFYSQGTYTYTDAQQNIRVPLTAYVYW